MPIATSYPGVYIEEIASGVRIITGVSTAITAFIGRSLTGPVNKPVRIQSYADFERAFGGLWTGSQMSYAVQHYFLHGGQDALIVRVVNGGKNATLSLPSGEKTLKLEADNPGVWGNAIQVSVDHQTKDSSDNSLFNLVVRRLEAPGSETVLVTEAYLNVSTDPDAVRFVSKVLEQESALVNVTEIPEAAPDSSSGAFIDANADGKDGDPIKDTQIKGNEVKREGIYALDQADIFNLLCVPPLGSTVDVNPATWAIVAAYSKKRRAMLIIDSPRTVVA